MPYKNKEEANVAAKERMKKYRNRVTPGVTPDEVKAVTPVTPKTKTVTPKNLKEISPFITQAAINAVTDPARRWKMERISEELHLKGLGAAITMGYPGPDFNVIRKMIEVTA